MIKQCNPGHLQQCVDIAFLRNNQPENNSTYCPKSKEGIHSDFEFVMNSPGSLIVGHFDDGALTGIMGCFVNPESNWVDCGGPFFAGEWDGEIANDMYTFAKSALTNAVRFNFNFDTRNKNLHQMMESLSATRGDNEYTLLLQKPDYKPQHNLRTVIPYSSKFENDVIQILHDTFPDAYISGRELIDSIGKEREVYCALDENGAFVGYGVLKRYKNEPSHIAAEIFAVKESERGKGYGWALLNTVVCCALNKYGAQTVGLIVDKLNTNARDLYYSCGFKLKVENSSYSIKLCEGGE